MSADAGASELLKKVAFLNRSGKLAKALKYGEVKAALEGLAESSALAILTALESEGTSVADPAAYILNAAANGGAGVKRKASGTSASGPVAKRVRLLDASGPLAGRLDYGRVADALGSLPMGQAMTILKALEDVGQSVQDPVGYVRAAVKSAGGTVPDEDDGVMYEDENAAYAEVQEDDLDSAEGQKWGGIRAKQEITVDGRDLAGVAGGDLSDAEQIERRVVWLNRFGNLQAPVELGEVIKALDSIGVQQAMRVLRRLQESADTVEDPNLFVRDLVGKSGWIWSKSEVVDEDTRVAKRVAWLNQCGGLTRSIDYSRVADVLDGLKVMHAMVLLRELEMSSPKVEDPTAWILRTAAKAGADDVIIPVDCVVDTPIGDRIDELNKPGALSQPIKMDEVADGLAKIGCDAALRLLNDLGDKGTTVSDPTAFLRFKLKAKLASIGSSLEEVISDETKILKRVEWLNDYGSLAKDIDYQRVSASLEAMGLESAMITLKELEDRAQGVEEPTDFILEAYRQSVKRRRELRKGGAAAKGGATANGNADIGTLAGIIGVLNKNEGVKKQVRFSEVALALDSLGHKRAMQVLEEMQNKGLGLDDPSAYIRAAAQRSKLAGTKSEAPDEEDDVAKITKRLKFLNDFGGLAKPIKIEPVIGALYCLGIPQSMAILRGLQEKGASIADPTQYIKGAVQRANGVRVPVKREIKEEDRSEDEAEDEEEPVDDDEDEEEIELEEEAVGAQFEPVDGDWEQDEADCNAYGWEGQAEEVAAPVEAEYEEIELEEPVKKKKKVEPEKKKHVEKRVVGALTGSAHLVPPRSDPVQRAENKAEALDDGAGAKASEPAPSARGSALPVTPQEKLHAVKKLVEKVGLRLDENCMKSLARLPFYRTKDLIDDVLLGGRNRTGVANPSRYLSLGVQKLQGGLGVEQGIAMEIAVSLGVVLNNDALDELASIKRKESHAIIRELSKDDVARKNPMAYIRQEVQRCRASLEALPFGAM